MVILEDLLCKFRENNDLEFEGRLFKTHVPSVAPRAYLNIIYRAANADVQREIIDPMGLPANLRAFYRRYNGARLFFDLLSIYGFLPRHYLLEREDWRKILPHSLVDSNTEYSNSPTSSSILLVGSYGYDRSEIYVDRTTGRVTCTVGRGLSGSRAEWSSFENWLEEEIRRLSECFDEFGNQLVEDEDTLPGRK